MKKLLTMLAIACAAFAACDSEGGDLNRTPILKVVGPNGSDPSQMIAIDGKSQEVTFTVLATADWTADIAGAEGFALSDRSGATGNTTVTVVAARNLSGATRTATVSFRLGGEERYAYTIAQTEEQPYLDVAPATIPIVGDRTEFTVAVSTNQPSWKVEIDSPDGDGWLIQQSKEAAAVTFVAEENTTGKNRTATLKFVSELHPEVFNYATVTQGYVVPAPTADLLDVVFAEDGTAKDVSAMGMTVEFRPNEFVSTMYLEKYGRFAAVFTHEPGLSKRETGYYVIEYNDNETFKSKLEDGYTMELLMRRYDDPKKMQIKPFAATQGGGASICFWADDANQIVMETGTDNAGKNAWKTAKTGVTPLKDVYYHVIAVWDQAAGTQKVYIDGELKATNNSAAGKFFHMTPAAGKRWFGIGADPGPNNLGEITFKGEVVIARIYDDPINADQVYALWKLVK